MGRKLLGRAAAGWTGLDRAVAGGVLALAFLSFGLYPLLLRPATGEEREVVVTAAGREVLRFPLVEQGGPRRYTVQGKISRLVIEVARGRVRLAEEEPLCPHRICLLTGWIHRPGQAIICVPNQVVIEVRGRRGAEIDAVSY
ncbi:MAG: NusG domain II-containing protein [Bacillota bacterium]|nr:NusG domain II-containing protein [Bacillota bacterium]